MSDLPLVERLRGIYNVPVSDGAGPLNGSMMFTREFKTSPIMHEAADRIEQIEAQLAKARSDALEEAIKICRNFAEDETLHRERVVTANMLANEISIAKEKQ